MNAIDSTHHKIEQANATQSAPKIVLRHLILGVLLSIVFTFVFVRIFDFVKDTGSDVTPFDRALLFFMYHHRAPMLTKAATFLAYMGSPPVIAGMALAAALVGLAWKKCAGQRGRCRLRSSVRE